MASPKIVQYTIFPATLGYKVEVEEVTHWCGPKTQQSVLEDLELSPESDIDCLCACVILKE